MVCHLYLPVAWPVPANLTPYLGTHQNPEVFADMKVLLVYPSFPKTFWSFTYALKFIGKKAAYPPLGLLTVAALLPPRWEQRLVDLNVKSISDTELMWADMVFVGGMTIQRSSAQQLIDRCRELGVTIVGGGPLFSVEPEAFGTVDHLVLDEAEVTLPQFVSDLENGCPRRVYRSKRYCDVRKTPVPSWDLVQLKKYASMSIQFSRGCPFNCDFCNVTALFGHRPRVKAARQIISELDSLYANGWRGSIFFVDDNFIANKRYLKKELLPALIRWRQNKKGCVFFTEATINLADDEELMAMMVEAGFNAVFIGIETPAEEALAECHKHQNKGRNLLEDVKTIQRTGLQVQGGFIVGFDSDSQTIFQRQIDFIQKSGIVTAMVGLLQAPPGTRLFERLKRENRIVGFITGDNVDGSTNIIPRMGLERLTDGYRSIMAHIYAPKHYYRRVKIFLEEFQAPAVKLPLDVHRLLAFFRSSIRLGIFGRERFHYWRLLTWTLFRRPRLLPVAITLAIYGHHFRRICEQYIL
jgi:radical SAM superfamily enzyme YgiQ (UPF0313 family)